MQKKACEKKLIFVNHFDMFVPTCGELTKIEKIGKCSNHIKHR